ncbi:MAG: ribonuclease P protein component [Chloroflexi bacterium]|nr:MAG: ribonuclease P protein component [Chloroflexota bacterium]
MTATRSQVPPLTVLRRKADFDAVGRRGTVRTTRLLVLRSLRTNRSETRVGLSTPRTLGGAVQRNRVRRRLRELVRERLEAIGFRSGSGKPRGAPRRSSIAPGALGDR